MKFCVNEKLHDKQPGIPCIEDRINCGINLYRRKFLLSLLKPTLTSLTKTWIFRSFFFFQSLTSAAKTTLVVHLRRSNFSLEKDYSIFFHQPWNTNSRLRNSISSNRTHWIFGKISANFNQHLVYIFRTNMTKRYLHGSRDKGSLKHHRFTCIHIVSTAIYILWHNILARAAKTIFQSNIDPNLLDLSIEFVL